METEPIKDSETTISKPKIDTETSDATSTTGEENTKNDTTAPMDIGPVESLVPINNSVVDTDTKALAVSSDVHGTSDEILERVLYRLTGGLPKCELNFIIQESNECEVALLEEIRILEEALATLSKDNDNSEMKVTESPNDPTAVTKATIDESTIHNILESPMTPLDRFYTASALLGRLRNDMASVSNTKDHNRSATTSPAVERNEEKAFEEFMDPTSPLHVAYTTTTIDQETLLSLWKKISMNRAAFVFKRPVKNEEAPGYTDRIYFPMDLSLIRKRIITNNIQTYVDFHNALALISHNCVKYNGRDSDYGRVARDFEATVDHVIVQAVRHTASYMDATVTSKENETSTKAVIAPPEVNHRQGTPNSAAKESLKAASESMMLGIDSTTHLVADTTNTNLTGISPTINDVKPKANHSVSGNAEDMIKSS